MVGKPGKRKSGHHFSDPRKFKLIRVQVLDAKILERYMIGRETYAEAFGRFVAAAVVEIERRRGIRHKIGVRHP